MRRDEQAPSMRVDERILTILERTVIEHHQTESGFVVLARKEPHAVLVKEPGREYRLSIDLDAC